jgi:Family of unknown function (DUF5871)
MSQNIVLPSTFNSKAKMTVSAPKVLSSGAKQAYLNYEGERLVMQTAENMAAPFGLNVADKYGPPEYSVNLSFRGQDQNPEIKQFMDSIAAIDEFMINEGVKNSKAWFKDNLGREVVKAFYTPSLKYSKDKDGNVLDYPPTIRLKLRKFGEEFETKFYDNSGTPHKGVPVEDLLVKGVQMTAIIECAGVWFSGSKYGLTWRAKQFALPKSGNKISGFAFKGLKPQPQAQAQAQAWAQDVEEADEEEEEVEDAAAFRAPQKPSVVTAMMPQAKPSVGAAVTAAETAMVDDEEGDDVEPAPAPKRTIIKKKVIAAKPK